MTLQQRMVDASAREADIRQRNAAGLARKRCRTVWMQFWKSQAVLTYASETAAGIQCCGCLANLMLEFFGVASPTKFPMKA